VRQGASTGKDARFARIWFEIPASRLASTREDTLRDGKWIGFAKGGRFAPYYSDVCLVVNWERDGEEAKRFASGLYGGQHWTRILKNTDFFFRPGLTYPRRADTFNLRALPKGCAFADKGPAVFAADEAALLSLLGVLNSTMISWVTAFRVPVADAARAGISPSFEVGAIQILPIPAAVDARVGAIAKSLLELHRGYARFDESTHDFVAPLLSTADRGCVAAWEAFQARATGQHAPRTLALKAELDDLVFDMYGVSREDRAVIRADVAASGVASPGVRSQDAETTEESGEDEDNKEDDDEASVLHGTLQSVAERLLSYALGCAFGRWDVRVGRSPDRAPPLSEPFAPLPRCSPGMLVGADGLPTTTAPAGYPLDVAWDGILVDEKGHPRDLVARVHDVFVALFGATADDRISELLAILRVPDLRSFFRERFFENVHRPMYTMGGNPPRRAPIYWPLYPRMGRRRAPFGVWLYYHRLSTESLFTVARLVRDRRVAEDDAAMKLRAEKGPLLKGAAARELSDRLEVSEGLTTALKDFESEITRVANLRCVPDFDDGIILNCAVLHDLMPWADAETAWETFGGGKYDWSNIAVKLRTEEAMAFREREHRLAEVAAAKTEAKQARAAKAAAKKAASRAAGGRRRRKGA